MNHRSDNPNNYAKSDLDRKTNHRHAHIDHDTVLIYK